MFEKEAEEILNNHCDCELLPECIAGIRCRCSDFEESKKLLIEGIEFEYNKAKEEFEASLAEWQRVCERKSDTNAQLIEQLADRNEKLRSIAEFQRDRYFKLKKATELISTLLNLWNDVMTEEAVRALIKEAEEFLKEVKK